MAEAAAASAAVTSLIDALTDLLAAEAARDFIETQRQAENKWDVWCGIMLIDEARVGKAGFFGPDGQAVITPDRSRLRGLKEQVQKQMNRRRAAIESGHPEFYETHKWDAHLNGLAAAQEKRWLDLMARLQTDADATLEPSKETTLEPPPHLSLVRS